MLAICPKWLRPNTKTIGYKFPNFGRGLLAHSYYKLLELLFTRCHVVANEIFKELVHSFIIQSLESHPKTRIPDLEPLISQF